MAFVLLVGFVVLFCYGVDRQRRIRRGQRQLGQLAELLLLRKALEISTRAANKSADAPEAQAPQA
jgi:hypothetical protein